MIKKAVPFNMIKQAFDGGVQDTLAYWHQLRIKFHDPIFYNHSIRGIASSLKISPTTASKHVKKMIELGWAHIHNDNLCIVSINKLNKSFLVLIPVSEIKAHQVQYLRYALLKRNTDKQNKSIIRKTELVKNAKNPYGYISKRKMRKINRTGGVEKFEKSIQNRITLSNRSIGFLFHRCSSTGSRYQKQFNDLGLIKSRPSYVLVQFDLFHHERGHIQLRWNGRAYRQTSNTIEEYPFLLLVAV